MPPFLFRSIYAVEEGLQPEVDQLEHLEGDEVRTPAEAGDCNRARDGAHRKEEKGEMMYPRHVYCSPGPYQKTTSHPTWGCKSVESEEELAEALASGKWFESIAEACDAAGEAAYPRLRGRMRSIALRKRRTYALPSDEAPPSRGEIEQQARKLGIRYNARTADKVLLARISEVMRGNGVHEEAIR
jgi:hypothetical protein